MRVTVAASGAVATVRAGRLHLEVWHHGGVTRCVPDGSPCGYRGTHWATVPAGAWGEMAEAAVASWAGRRGEWKPCE